jgi:hypothetical protein
VEGGYWLERNAKSNSLGIVGRNDEIGGMPSQVPWELMEYGYVIVSKWLVLAPNIGIVEGWLAKGWMEEGRMEGRGISERIFLFLPSVPLPSIHPLPSALSIYGMSDIPLPSVHPSSFCSMYIWNVHM